MGAACIASGAGEELVAGVLCAEPADGACDDAEEEEAEGVCAWLTYRSVREELRGQEDREREREREGGDE